MVQDVHAPPQYVWEKIFDFNHYTSMVPHIVLSENYHVSPFRRGKQQINTQMKAKLGPFLSFEFFIRHLYEPAQKSLSWTLDYAKKSDLDEAVGLWYVAPHPVKDGTWSRVYYSVYVSFYDWVPMVVIQMMKNKALIEATRWVKANSEREYERKIGETNGPMTSCVVSDEGVPTCSLQHDFGEEFEGVGLLRYFLVGLVFFLVLANLYLCLERMAS